MPCQKRNCRSQRCLPRRCGDSGPSIRFPFWLKGQLSCSPSNTTVLNLQFPVTLWKGTSHIVFPLRVKLRVLEIFYKLQQIRVSFISGDYLPAQDKLPSPINSSSVSPYTVVLQFYPDAFTLFNCSTNENNMSQIFSEKPISCLSGCGYQIYAFHSDYRVSLYSLLYCAKMCNVDNIPWAVYNRPEEAYDYIQWSKPSCGDCEALGKHCRLNVTECFDIDRQPGGPSKTLVISVVIVTLFLVLAITIVLHHVISLKKKKEDQRKIEKFLDDYKASRPARFSYADIKRITCQFKDKLGGGYGTVYKGNLSNDFHVAVKVLKNFRGNDEEFINEVGTIGTIHHKNVVRLVGYCADGYKRALLHEFLPNDSLEKIITSRKRINSLSWEKLRLITTLILRLQILA